MPTLIQISPKLNQLEPSIQHTLTYLTLTLTHFIQAHIDDLNNTINTGFYPLNWTSQRIPQYIEELNGALLRFSSIISQVHKNSQMINDIINRIANTILVRDCSHCFDRKFIPTHLSYQHYPLTHSPTHPSILSLITIISGTRTRFSKPRRLPNVH